MIADIINTLSQVISRAASESKSPVRGRRIDRRYQISRGIEGLEMRLSPTAIAPVLVTVTNQPTASYPPPPPPPAPPPTAPPAPTAVATMTPTTSASIA